MHTSVFAQEAVDALGVKPNEHYIDATYGEGGHAREIERRGGIVLGIDADPDQVKKAGKQNVIHGNFSDIENIATNAQFIPVSGVLFDFGLSMEQLAHGGRGLSFKRDSEPLDMRINPTCESFSATEYLNESSVIQLTDDFSRFAEEERSENIAKIIERIRSNKPFQTVGDLRDCIDLAYQGAPPTVRQTVYARIFQAIRMVVNDEERSIQKGLEGSLAILKTGGKLVTITFHSVEDRFVKRFFVKNKNRVHHTRLSVAKHRALASFERSATMRIGTVL